MKLYDTLAGSDYLEIEVDSETFTVSLTANGEDRGVLATYTSWDELCGAYPRLWQQIVADHGGEEAFYTYDEEDEVVAPADLRAVRARQERRASARAAAETSDWDVRLERVRALLDAFDGTEEAVGRLPKRSRDLDLTPEGLKSSFELVIEIERTDDPVPVGGSKIGGAPHLPPGLEWPTIDGEETTLLVQLALAEIARADPSGVVPAEGVLYAFVTENARGTLLYTDSTDLTPRSPAHAIPEHLQRLYEGETRLTFSPSFYFGQPGDTMGPLAIARALPRSLLDDIARALGIEPGEPSDAFGGDRIFGGDPIDWQAMHESYLANPLFAQICYADGHQSIGVHPDDLRMAYFDDADCRYCGT